MDSKQTHCPSFAPEEDVVFIILHSKQNFCSYLQLPRLHYAWKYSVEQKPVGAFAHKTWRNMSNPWRIISLHFVCHQTLFPSSIADRVPLSLTFGIFKISMWNSDVLTLALEYDKRLSLNITLLFSFKREIELTRYIFFSVTNTLKAEGGWKGMVTSSKHLHLNI